MDKILKSIKILIGRVLAEKFTERLNLEKKKKRKKKKKKMAGRFFSFHLINHEISKASEQRLPRFRNKVADSSSRIRRVILSTGKSAGTRLGSRF